MKKAELVCMGAPMSNIRKVNKKIIKIAIVALVIGWIFILVIGHMLRMRPRENRTDVSPLAELSHHEVSGFGEMLSILYGIQSRESTLEIHRMMFHNEQGYIFNIRYLPITGDRRWPIYVFETSELAEEFMRRDTRDSSWRFFALGYELITNGNDTSAMLFRNSHHITPSGAGFYRVWSRLHIGNTAIDLGNSRAASVWNFSAMAEMEAEHSEIIRLIADIAAGEFLNHE